MMYNFYRLSNGKTTLEFEHRVGGKTERRVREMSVYKYGTCGFLFRQPSQRHEKYRHCSAG